MSQQHNHNQTSRFAKNPILQLHLVSPQQRIKTQDDQKNIFNIQQTINLKTEKSTSVPREKNNYMKLSNRKKLTQQYNQIPPRKNQTFHIHEIQVSQIDHLPSIQMNNKTINTNIKNEAIVNGFQNYNLKNNNDERISVEDFYYRFYTPQKFKQELHAKYNKHKDESGEKKTQNQKNNKVNNSLVINNNLPLKIKNSVLLSEEEIKPKFQKLDPDDRQDTFQRQQKEFQAVYLKLKTINDEPQHSKTRTVTPKQVIQPDENTFRQITDTKKDYFDQYSILKPGLITYLKQQKNAEFEIDSEVKLYLNSESILKRETTLSLLIKPFQQNSNIKLFEPINNYYQCIQVKILNNLLTYLEEEKLRNMIKQSFVNEWVGIIIINLIKLEIIQNKSNTEQLRLMKVIQANQFVGTKLLLGQLLKINNLNETDKDFLRLSLKFADQKNAQFYLINQAIPENLYQINALLSYISESNVIMYLNNKQLQDKLRQYFKLKPEKADLNQYLSIITIILQEMKFHYDNQKKKPIPPKYLAQNNKFTQEPLPPFLPEIKDQVYTLVLDLDETLVHFIDTGTNKHLLVRPYVNSFLSEMSRIYELVIFTAGLENYANWYQSSYFKKILRAIDQIDVNNLISHRLFRQHTTFQMSDQSYVKDLNKLGRSLSKTIIIDNTPQNFRLQPQNGIQIKTWFNDQNDTCLNELIPVLKQIRERGGDLREQMQQIKLRYGYQTSFILP